MNKKYKIIIVFLFLFLISFFFINLNVLNIGNQYIVENIEEIENAEVAIILGALVFDDRLSPIAADRTDTAIELYNNQKVNKILVSGDHGKKDYDEVNTIKNYLLEKGIPSDDIF